MKFMPQSSATWTARSASFRSTRRNSCPSDEAPKLRTGQLETGLAERTSLHGSSMRTGCFSLTSRRRRGSWNPSTGRTAAVQLRTPIVSNKFANRCWSAVWIVSTCVRRLRRLRKKPISRSAPISNSAGPRRSPGDTRPTPAGPRQRVGAGRLVAHRVGRLERRSPRAGPPAPACR